MDSDIEARILCRELGKLAGPIGRFGASWAAKRLPNVASEVVIEFAIDRQRLMQAVSKVFFGLGKAVPEFPSSGSIATIATIVGSGHMNMNPTLAHAQVVTQSAGSKLVLRAVAKEGAISQDSAKKAILAIRAALEEELA